MNQCPETLCETRTAKHTITTQPQPAEHLSLNENHTVSVSLPARPRCSAQGMIGHQGLYFCRLVREWRAAMLLQPRHNCCALIGVPISWQQRRVCHDHLQVHTAAAWADVPHLRALSVVLQPT